MKKLFFFLLVLSDVVNSAEHPNILKIFEHFTLTSAAASECIKPEKSELTSFLANYQVVTIHALQELQRRKPDLSKEQAQEIIKNGASKATEAVRSVIAKEGCGSPKIQDLIKRFHMQAQWKP